MSHRPAAKLAALAVCVALLAVAVPSQSARAAPITVTTTTDELTTNGQCSLREAVRNANANAAVHPDCPAGTGADTITLPAGTYTLTLTGLEDDLASNNDLDILDPAGLTIIGTS